MGWATSGMEWVGINIRTDMHSFTIRILSLLALSGAAVSSAVVGLVPAQLGQSLGKRDVQCDTEGVFCLDDFTCMIGSDGQPGCCPQGEICSGPGGIETIIATNTVAVEHTLFSTFVVRTTGINIEPTTTTEAEADSTTTTDSESETEMPSSTDEEEESTIATDTEPVPTTLYPTMTGPGNSTITGHPNGTNQTTTTTEDSEGGASGMVLTVGFAGVVAALVGLVVV